MALVIDTFTSSDWRFSSHGRKIEKAIKLKEKICWWWLLLNRRG